MPQNRDERLIYGFILLGYLVLGILFAWRVPAWQAPDEPAHYNYIAQVASGDILPKIEMGDWDNAYLEALKAQDFAPELLENLSLVQYENHQPPLYYWLASPFFLLSNGNLFVIRIYSLLLGAITIGLSFAIGREVFPNRPQIALAAMALIAFLPQNLHILSSVNNDALAGTVLATMLFLALRYLKKKNVAAWQLGLVLGIAFITKTTIYFMAAVMLLVLVLHWWGSTDRKFSSLLRSFISFALPAGILALSYWGRNIFTYGFPDFLGLIAHDRVVVGQTRTSDYIAQVGIDAYWQNAITTSFNSFWGQFGWMEARLADALPYALWYIIAVLILAVLGLLIHLVSQKEIANPPQVQNKIWAIFWLVIGLTSAMYIYYNLSFVQFQGRYLFTAIIPLGLLLGLGLDTWRELLRLNGIFSYLSPLFFLVFVILNFYLIWRVIPCAVGCLG